MIRIDFKFSLDVANKELKELMQRFDGPYPVLRDAITTTVSANFQDVPEEAEKAAFIKSCEQALTEANFARFVVESAKFAGIGDIRKVSEEALP